MYKILFYIVVVVLINQSNSSLAHVEAHDPYLNMASEQLHFDIALSSHAFISDKVFSRKRSAA